MFDKKQFSNILQKVTNTYTSISEFSEKSNVNRTYLSKYINMKLDNPPTPKILQKITNASNDTTTYEELMLICGYLDKNMEINEIEKNIFKKYIPIFKKMEIDNYMLDIIYKAYIEDKECSEYREQLKVLINKFPVKKQDEIYGTMTKMAEESKELYKNTINDIAIRVKYNIEDPYQNIQFYMCPVYGRIAAGQPNWAEECIEGRLPIDPNLMDIVNPEECYFLRVNRRKHEQSC